MTKNNDEPLLLFTENFAGNLHQAAETINKLGLAPYLVSFWTSGFNSIGVFRMSQTQWDLFKKSWAPKIPQRKSP